MKKYFSILLFAGCYLFAESQLLSEVRCYIDDPSNITNAIVFSGTIEYESDINIDLTGISQGYHILFIETKDESGKWSHYATQNFLVSGTLGMSNLSSAEYFFDLDPGFGNGISIPVPIEAEINEDLDIPIPPDLSQGSHQLYVRTKDGGGQWSHVTTFPIELSGNLLMSSINLAEYFFDSDPGQGNGFPIALLNSEDFTGNINLQIPSDIDQGIHNLYVRTMDNGGQWSHYSSMSIEISGSTGMFQLVEAEYFFDIDPGAGNGSAVLFPANPLVDLDLEIPVPPDLPLGPHMLYIRAGDDGNGRSHYDAIPVNVCSTYAPTAQFNSQRYQGGYYVEMINTSELAESVEWTIDGNTITSSDSLFWYFNAPGQYEVCLEAMNSCGEDQSCSTVSVNGISDFFARKGNNTGLFSMTIRGGFVPGAIVSLTREGYPDIVAEEVVFWNEGELRVLFDLRNQEIGWWDLEVDMGIEGIFTEPSAFEIINGTPPEINISLEGIRVSRAGRVEPYHLRVENYGDEDAVGVPVIIRQAPVGVATVLTGDSTVALPASSFPYFDDLVTEQINIGFDPALITPFTKNLIDNTYGYGFIIPQVPAHSSVELDFTIECAAPGFQFNGRTSYYPWLKSTAVLAGETDFVNSHCRSVEFKQVLEEVLGSVINQVDWENCFTAAYSNATSFLAELAQNPGYNTTQLIPLPAYNGAILLECANCLGIDLDADEWENALARFDRLSKFMTVDYSNCDEINPQLIPIILRETELAAVSSERVFDCTNGGGGGGGGFSSGAFMGGLNPANRDAFENLCRILSSDPNTKEGPIFNGAWINGVMNIPYQVWFENVDTATAPAQTVIITDTLDASRYDFDAFEWTTFGFSGRFFNIPLGRIEHYEVVDLRPEIPNLLKFTAQFDPSTGIAFAEFVTLDTLTLELTADPLQGFLPPDVTHPEGQGFVGFRLPLLDGLDAGDEINNNASITFDYNETIITEYWNLNFDDIPPTSSFTNANEVFSETFNLTWIESDAHSGVEHLEIYSIIDGNPYLFAIVNPSVNQLEISASYGQQLEFAIVAYDFAGNVQETPSEVTIDIIDSVNDTSSPVFVIYPNPADKEINLSNCKVGSTYYVFDATGRCISSGVANSYFMTLDVSRLEAGVYQIRLEELNRQIVVQH